ncbi:U-box domain-containing protein 70 isoform X1 [Lactuca sativa]|uniref:non-specific serine/threonine protein kinase n=2 Tax=Lactuca sativa TaxID=4236 RepID=A0A9R1X0X9_LACSA|nr:U-box domain-containing protein 70 isoform X1 [Lactuca sativa]KAJ0194209.1 hypothetical protein LSAT_V11C800407910 [Lactuca sativa]
MGASRKLQSEIDRVLKKVQESVDVFDSIWNKVYDTDNAYQRERFEAELKKEIKKLQRYRDQIKTWIQSSEIKDKKVSASYEQALMDARKLIEREMERFRICEKDTKTKAFSKERLGQQPKWDYKEKAKSETRDWLNNTVFELESQIDGFEAEMEGLSLKKGKVWPPRLRHLESSIARHKAHILKLELILRLLDNDELSPELINDVKDFTDDYVERNQEDFDEFEDVDMLYDILQLDKVEALEDFVISGTPGLIKVGASMNNIEHRFQATSLFPVIVPLTKEGKQNGYKVGANMDNIEQRFQATCQLPVVIPLTEERQQNESQPFIQVVANMDKVEQRLQATHQLPIVVPLTEEKKQIESQPLIQAGTSMDNTEQRLQATCQLPIIVPLPPEEVIKQNGYKDFDHLKIPLGTLLMATNNFSKEYVIAKGGFGLVYKAQNEHGIIAVKKLDPRFGQGEREFMMEIAMLSAYTHKNLVSLVGFCDEGDEKVLVYKYESNGSLDQHLCRKDLTWIQRLRICLDVAQGLKYLHNDIGTQHRILHRDMKSSNILLDENFRAKISDFGLSKVALANVPCTVLISKVCGTPGYVDPEYYKHGILTQKSDVYSFGVVMFEVLCGKLVGVSKHHDEPFSVELPQSHYEKGTLDVIIDYDLRIQMNSASLSTFSAIAHQCLKCRGRDRPTMTLVVEELKKAFVYQEVVSPE